MKAKTAKTKEVTDQRVPQTTYFSPAEMRLIERVRENFGPSKPSMAFTLRTLVLEAAAARETVAASK